MAKKKKKIEPVCKNCKLYDAKNGWCGIEIIGVPWELEEGINKLHLPVDPSDSCFFGNKFVARDGEVFDLLEDVKQVKAWIEDPVTGEKTDKDGVVKIEYPKDLELKLRNEED